MTRFISDRAESTSPILAAFSKRSATDTFASKALYNARCRALMSTKMSFSICVNKYGQHYRYTHNCTGLAFSLSSFWTCRFTRLNMNGFRIMCKRLNWCSFSLLPLFSAAFSMSLENHSLNSSCESNKLGMIK
jgi:hypothetical protein